MFVLLLIPEKKGCNLEQLDELFAKKVPTWKFDSYVTEHVAVDAEKGSGRFDRELGKRQGLMVEQP